MAEDTLTLKFVCLSPGADKRAGETITMPVSEYKGLILKTHKKNKYKKGHPRAGTPVFTDPRLNHTIIIEGAELLEKPAGPKAPSTMTVNECKTELTHKNIEFSVDDKLPDLQKIVKDNRK